MNPIRAESRTSTTRSRLRLRLLLTLSSLGEGTLGQLSHATGIPPYRVKCILYGKLPAWSPERALIPCGLAREVATTHRGRKFEVTNEGRRLARSITSARAHGHMRDRMMRKADTLL